MDDLRHLARESYLAKNWAEAADYARRAIESGVPTADLMHLAMILCVSLTACGLRPRAKRFWENLWERLTADGISQEATASSNARDFALFAAVAVGDESRAEMIYRRRFEQNTHVERVVISEARALRQFTTTDVTVLRSFSPSEVFVDQRETGSGQWQYVTDPMIFASVANGILLAGWDYVVTQDRVVVADSGYNPLTTPSLKDGYPQCCVEDIGLVAHAWTDAVHQIDADVFFLSAPPSFHYGHWLVDFLPRLQGLEIINDPSVMIVVPAELPRKHRDLITCFGIGEDRIFNCELGKRYQFRKVFVGQTGTYYFPNPRSIHFLRRHLGRRAALSHAPKQCYFLERGAGTRLPANRAEFNTLLSEFGFRHIDLSQLPLDEEHELLADAAIIVGAHGTELLSMFGVPPGAELIELIWDVSQDPVVGPICSFLGIRHQFLICAEAPRAAKQNYRKDRDMIIDCDELRRRISAAIERKGLNASIR